MTGPQGLMVAVMQYAPDSPAADQYADSLRAARSLGSSAQLVAGDSMSGLAIALVLGLVALIAMGWGLVTGKRRAAVSHQRQAPVCRAPVTY